MARKAPKAPRPVQDDPETEQDESATHVTLYTTVPPKDRSDKEPETANVHVDEVAEWLGTGLWSTEEYVEEQE